MDFICKDCKHHKFTIERVHDSDQWFNEIVCVCVNRKSEFFEKSVSKYDWCGKWEGEDKL